MARPTPFGVLVAAVSVLSFAATADIIAGRGADRIAPSVEICVFDRIDRIVCPSVTLSARQVRLRGDVADRRNRGTLVCEWMRRTSLSGLIKLDFVRPYTCWVV